MGIQYFAILGLGRTSHFLRLVRIITTSFLCMIRPAVCRPNQPGQNCYGDREGQGRREKLHHCIYKDKKPLFSLPTLKLRRQFDSRKAVIIGEDPTSSLFICLVYS